MTNAFDQFGAGVNAFDQFEEQEERYMVEV